MGAAALSGSLFHSLAAFALAVFTVPQVVALLVEPPVMLWAARFRRQRVIGLGFVTFGVAVGLTALANAPWLFTLGLSAAYIATGVACAAAQAALMDADPERRERRMAEWTIGGSLGDLCTPLVLAAGALLGFGHRPAWLLVALLLVGYGLLIGRRPMPQSAAHGEEDEAGASPTVAELWREARRRPRLVAWLFAATMCSLMDETLVAFTALQIEERFPTLGAATVALTSLMIGGFAGLLILHRLLSNHSSAVLLAIGCLGSVASVACWLSSTTLAGATASLFALGASAATHYPLAQAAAYRAWPERSNWVAALGALFAPLDLCFPLLLGLIADRFGVEGAIVGLLLQPAALLAVLALGQKVRPQPARTPPA